MSTGPLHTTRFGSGAQPALAVHDITGSSRSWAPVGDALPPEWTLVAVDLRGRDLFSRVVLVDGGVALPVPDGADPDLLPEAGLAAYDAEHVTVEVVPDANHYTIVFVPAVAERVAQAIAGR